MRIQACLMLVLLAGCATSFTGDAHFKGGSASCQQKCGLQGLEMAGLVYMGEYSSACICEVPGGNTGQTALRSTAATTGAAVAVMKQMQDAAMLSTISTMIILGAVTGVGLGAGG